MKHFIDQEIQSAIEKAPKPIQDEIASGEDTAIIIGGLGRRFNLHLDVVGMIAELNRDMLLGLVSPQEFLNELLAAKISEADARQIMAEINQKIFAPLREQMRRAGSAAGAAGTAVAGKPVQPAAAPVAQNGAAVYAPPPQSPAYVRPENPAPASQPSPTLNTGRPPSRIAPLPPKTVLPNSAGGANSAPSRPLLRLEDHEEPHIEIHKKAQDTAAPRIQSQAPAPLAPPSPPPRPPSKPYSADPYREPIE